MIFADVELNIKTKNKNEILLLRRKSQEDDFKTVLVIGVFHGDEPDGEYLINRYLSTKSYNKNELIFVPCLNPDGKSLSQRTTSNGVDLNRNFPTQNWVLSERDEYFGGDKPASESETQMMIYVIERYKPDLIIALHAPYCVVNFDGPAQIIADKISQIIGFPVQENIGYPTPGSFGTYCGIEKNIPTITLELPENLDKETLWCKTKGLFDYIACEF